MTISGVTRGKSMSMLAGCAPRPRHRASPTASATPSGVAMTIVNAASLRLWNRARRRLGSCQTERSGSPRYQRSEKPDHALRERPALKENSTAMITGTRDQTM